MSAQQALKPPRVEEELNAGWIDRLKDLRQQFGYLEGADLIRAMVTEGFPGEIAVNSSFGAEAVVLLDLVSEVDKSIPVIFVDTLRHFPETLNYRNKVVEFLGLTDVRSVGPSQIDCRKLDPDFRLSQTDTDACCNFRKVIPLEKALSSFEAVIGGRKRYHGADRSELPSIEYDGMHYKVNPLVTWDKEKIESRFKERDLPRHPMVEDGFLSIGCMPCTERSQDGNARSGRWTGLAKTECGIHRQPFIGEGI
ncbi:MAG: phosphoadenylyl-sulfate reductase [Rhodospirillales bacterium]|nr:phosphoadenylyl-sulfate reductase [Rhodospirillales bacterium]